MGGGEGKAKGTEGYAYMMGSVEPASRGSSCSSVRCDVIYARETWYAVRVSRGKSGRASLEEGVE